MAKIVELEKPTNWSDEDWQEYLELRHKRLAAIWETYKKCPKPDVYIRPN